jgi:hypothetical protein
MFDLEGDVLREYGRDGAENFLSAVRITAPIASLGIALFIHFRFLLKGDRATRCKNSLRAQAP